MYLTFRQGGPVLAPLRSNFGQIGLYVGQSIAPCRAASAWVPRVTPIPPEGPLRSARSHVRGADLRYRPLYAALDRDDADHRQSRRLVAETRELLIIPAPVLVDVDYWIQRRLHPGILVALLDDIAAGAFLVEDLLPRDYRRIHEICDRYADADVGFVDAAVLAIVERLNEPKLATLDRRHFGLLRPRHVDALLLLPD